MRNSANCFRRAADSKASVGFSYEDSEVVSGGSKLDEDNDSGDEPIDEMEDIGMRCVVFSFLILPILATCTGKLGAIIEPKRILGEVSNGCNNILRSASFRIACLSILVCCVLIFTLGEKCIESKFF